MDYRNIRNNNRNRQMAQQLQRRGMGSMPSGSMQPMNPNLTPAYPNPDGSSSQSDQSPPSGGYSSNGNYPNHQYSNSGVPAWAQQGQAPGWQNRSGQPLPPPGAPAPGQGLPNARGGQGRGGQYMNNKFSGGIMKGFQPGNIGDINRVIWPFAFQFQSANGGVVDIAPGQSQTLSFSVTQEAGFLMRQLSHSTFRLNQVTGEYVYIDPFYFDESANSPNGLTYTMEDASSSRFYTGRTEKDIAMLGNANFPSIWPSTILLLPNQVMALNLTNQGLETYRCFVTVWGYRIRVEDAQNLLSTVWSD